jgi:hypothetical protein
LLFQFAGEHDRFQVNHSEWEIFKGSNQASKKYGHMDIYGFAFKYYKNRMDNTGFIKKPSGSRWYDWGKETKNFHNKKIKYNKK